MNFNVWQRPPAEELDGKCLRWYERIMKLSTSN